MDIDINYTKRLAETGDAEVSERAMRKLKLVDPTYHFCEEWDGMVICKTDPEYESCLCVERVARIKDESKIPNAFEYADFLKKTYESQPVEEETQEELTEFLKKRIRDSFNASEGGLGRECYPFDGHSEESLKGMNRAYHDVLQELLNRKK